MMGFSGQQVHYGYFFKFVHQENDCMRCTDTYDGAWAENIGHNNTATSESLVDFKCSSSLMDELKACAYSMRPCPGYRPFGLWSVPFVAIHVP